MQRHGTGTAVRRGVSDLVVPQRILDEDHAAVFAAVSHVLGANELVIAAAFAFPVAALPDLAPQYPHPASVAGVVVDGAFPARVPTQKQQRVRLVVRRDEVASVVFVGVGEGEARPVAVVQPDPPGAIGSVRW